MKLFRKKIMAYLLSALIILLSTVVSVNIKLGKECSEVVDGFYKGVMLDGVRDVSIRSQLEVISEASESIAALAERNGLNTEDFRSDIEYFKRLIVVMDEDISHIYYCYKGILDHVMNLGYALNELSLSSADEAGGVSSLQAILDAKDLIEASAYNESVRTYLNSLRFPTEFLAELSGVELPEYFA